MSNRVEINGEALEGISGGSFDVKSDGGNGYKVRSRFTGEVFHIENNQKYTQFLAYCANSTNSLEGDQQVISACWGAGVFD